MKWPRRRPNEPQQPPDTPTPHPEWTPPRPANGRTLTTAETADALEQLWGLGPEYAPKPDWMLEAEAIVWDLHGTPDVAEFIRSAITNPDKRADL